MTKSELAAQKCADLAYEKTKLPWGVADFIGSNGSRAAFRRFIEHVSDLCEHAIASGDTSGLEELVLREPVDADLLEAREVVAVDGEQRNLFEFATDVRQGGHDKEYSVKIALTALRRGREIERGEG